MSTPRRLSSAAAAVLVMLATGCTETPDASPALTGPPGFRADVHPAALSYALDPPVYDITVAPDGGLLAVHGTSVIELRKGQVAQVADVPVPRITDGPTPTLNGIASLGRGTFFIASGGGDVTVGAALWQVSRGDVRLVGDISAFVLADPIDMNEGPAWDDPVCNAGSGFSAGPASNPYHVTVLGGGAALVADAAGNTLLRVEQSGDIDWVALLTPSVDGGISSDPDDWASGDPADWMPGTTDGCYTQPVPTSVAIGPDGGYYVSELTGSSASQPLGATGVSRVWRIEPDARHVTCPSEACRPVLFGLTTVIDAAFGPDGMLYVAEYDFGGWLDPFVAGLNTGDVQRCDVWTHTCETFVDDLTLPSAIAFDRAGNLWLLENNLFDPTVRRVDGG